MVQIASTYSAFAALKADGTVVTWGDANLGGDSSKARMRGCLEPQMNCLQQYIYNTYYNVIAIYECFILIYLYI